MKVKFWGVRGSLPAPIPPTEIENKIMQALRGAIDLDLHNARAIESYVKSLPYYQRTTTGGNTSCVEVQGNNTEIILDAGSGIRQLGIDLPEVVERAKAAAELDELDSAVAGRDGHQGAPKAGTKARWRMRWMI